MEEILGFTAFAGQRRLATGSLADVARQIRQSLDAGEKDPIILFDDATGKPIDLDLRGTPEEVAARAETTPEARSGSGPGATEAAAETQDPAPGAGAKAGPGRPRLGVVAREVTLLPRHWEWLSAQPGGASVTLRKLVEIARKRDQGLGRIRKAQEAAYGFILAVAGDLPGFEEASRALFAWDPDRFAERIAEWPPDVREHAMKIVRRGLSTAEEIEGAA